MRPHTKPDKHKSYERPRHLLSLHTTDGEFETIKSWEIKHYGNVNHPRFLRDAVSHFIDIEFQPRKHKNQYHNEEYEEYYERIITR